MIKNVAEVNRMIAYHGSVVGNLSMLKPFANPHSNLDYPCVYLSTCKALASIYIWKPPYKWMTFEINENGIPVYNESFQNGLFEFYHSVKGYIYTCDGNFLVDENTKIRHAVISKEPVKISDVDMVEDAYERILQYERAGLIVINRYEDRSEKQKMRDRNMVLRTIANLNLLKGEHPLSGFVRAKFPNL